MPIPRQMNDHRVFRLGVGELTINHAINRYIFTIKI